jgi:hypothetical protein
VGNCLVWKVSKGNKVWLGEDPWVGCQDHHILNVKLVQNLRDKGYFRLCHAIDRDLTIVWR